jgi:hypothetical protein
MEKTYELHPDVPFETQSGTVCCNAGVPAAGRGDPKAGAEGRRQPPLSPSEAAREEHEKSVEHTMPDDPVGDYA